MGKTLLVVDDSKTIRRVVELTFRATGISVVVAANAGDAIAKATSARPDVVLVDAQLGSEDGYEVCRALRASLRASPGADTPILILDSAYRPFDEARGAQVGAVGHLAKPFDSQTLIDTVKQMTGLPVENGAPLSFAASLARRQEAAAHAEAAAVEAVDDGPIPIDDDDLMDDPRGGTLPPHAPVIASPPEPEPPPAPPVPSDFDMAAPSGDLDDVVIEEPVDALPTGPTLEPPTPPAAFRSHPAVDMWALADEGTEEIAEEVSDEIPIEVYGDEVLPIEDAEPVQDTPTVDMSPSQAVREVAQAVAVEAAPALAEAVAPAVPGLSKEELTAMARDIIEKIAWEVVPELAETIIRAELDRLLADDD